MFIGREREIEKLDELLGAAMAGYGGLRVLSGEPGIGKTRLADEVARRAGTKGFTVSWGRASETGGAPAYWPWIELLAPLVEKSDDVPAPLRALFGSHRHAVAEDGTRADPERERFELFEGVSSFVRACACRTPLLLVFDDLHAADVASLELLAFVARGLRSSRIAALGAYRDLEARRPPVADTLARVAREGETMPLPRLSPEEVAALVRYETRGSDAALSEAIHGLTDGNPLFLCETIRAVNANRSVPPIDTLRDIAALGGVLALVRSRLAGANDETRAVLDVASVFGRESELSLLAEVAGRTSNETLGALEEAEERGLLVRRREDRWAFSHVLVREAFYCQLVTERRRATHHRIAVALGKRGGAKQGAQTELLATMAHHAMAALPMGDAEGAVQTARLAAAQARAQLAYEEATTLLERALATCIDHHLGDRERVEVLLALGWAVTDGGKLDRGRQLFREAAKIAERVGDPTLFARAALGQGAEYVLAEIRTELVDVLRAALRALVNRTGDEERRLCARLLARLAAALTPSTTPEPLALARQALAMTEGETDSRTRIDVDVGVGSALTDFAPPGERVVVNERLLRDARQVSDRILELRALTRLACDYLERGDVARADATIAARAALAESIGHPRHLWQTPLLRSMRSMPHGRFDECESHIQRARTLAAEAPDPNAQRCIEFHRFSMLLVTGRTEGLRAQESRVHGTLLFLQGNENLRVWLEAVTAAALGDKARAAEALLRSSHATTARLERVGRLESAVCAESPEICEQLYTSFDPLEDANACWGPFAFVCGPPIAQVLGMAAFYLGRSAEALRHCERALALADRTDADAHRASIHLAWGEGLGASSHLERAIEIAEKVGMPEIVRRAKGALGRRETPSGAPRIPVAQGAPIAGFALRREGEQWTVEHVGQSFRLRNLRGLAMLAQLADHPGREIHSLDLAAHHGGGEVDLGDAGDVIDPRAREAYKKRITDLREELAEAEQWRDDVRAARVRVELEALTQQVAAATGLGGRARRTGSAPERARVTVQRRIREAIKKIAEHDAALGRHLDWAVRTGTFCLYDPDRRKSGR
jgi:tetratricopeptide (TPR) repeat protein